MWHEQTLDLGSDRSLHVAQAGAGPDIVLIHGALTTGHDWRTSPVAAALANTHRVTAIDRPGHGSSQRLRFEGTPRDQADQIAEGLERLGIGPTIVAGHSFGGMVTLALAERHSELLAAMILLAPIAFPEPRLLEQTLLAPRALPLAGPILSRFGQVSQLDRTLLPVLHKMMFHPQEVPAGWKESYPFADILDPQALVFEGEDAAATLPLSPSGTLAIGTIDIPARVLIGTADKIIDEGRQASGVAALLPNARIDRIEGAGHMIHHTHPDLILTVIRDMVARPA
ncbi:alpha/beta fold hydrolase [Allosphingosinicella deserti]|uniref:Alpha/beta hydrolase n=1 Tax=Allosphingosinicella deserti TaxID=2116704 RepID=A0A2P7QSA9_9SPHN|nr:alpha/beta hydrolase [Sphingomonas deserti]PSJ40854.1 alpha/beta hydrolase [Sphingomonas deserti]